MGSHIGHLRWRKAVASVLAAAASLAACGGEITGPIKIWFPGEVDLQLLSSPCVTIAGDGISEDCTYRAFDANGIVPQASVQWEVRPNLVSLRQQQANDAGLVRIQFNVTLQPGGSAELWMCAARTLPCTLIDYVNATVNVH
jgi:hypothetical protein